MKKSKNKSWEEILGTSIGVALVLWFSALLISVSVSHLFHYSMSIAYTVILIVGIYMPLQLALKDK